MSKVTLTPKTKSDLNDIWDYSLETWGIVKAEAYLRMLDAKFKELAVNPNLAPSAEYIRAGYRKSVVESHVIYFKENKIGVDVIRILHQRMDFRGKI